MSTKLRDDAVYGDIQTILNKKYPGKERRTRCVVNDLRHNKVVDEFYTPDLLVSMEKLEREIQPYVDKVKEKCDLDL